MDICQNNTFLRWSLDLVGVDDVATEELRRIYFRGLVNDNRLFCNIFSDVVI